MVNELSSQSNYSQETMEQDIWILWINQLDLKELDVLDLDAIEDRLHEINVLGSGTSRLGVNFGRWTSRDDQFNAWVAAAREAAVINNRFLEMQGE